LIERNIAQLENIVDFFYDVCFLGYAWAEKKIFISNDQHMFTENNTSIACMQTFEWRELMMLTGNEKKKRDETNFVITQHAEWEGKKRDEGNKSSFFALPPAYTRSINIKKKKKRQKQREKKRYYVSICVRTIARYTSVGIYIYIWERTWKPFAMLFSSYFYFLF